MKIATYNIWNHPTAREERFNALCDVLIKVNADVIVLQEVPIKLHETTDPLFLEKVALRTGYGHVLFKDYPGDDEGLGFLSRTPLEEVECKSGQIELFSNCAMRVKTNVNGVTIGVTNVHLDWKSALTREKEIVAVTEWIEHTSLESQAEFLCGDFNSLPNTSSIYNFLIGQQSLAGKDTSWIDLHQFYANTEDREPAATLDFKQNPWLQDRDKLNEFRKPVRFDWILLKSLYPSTEPDLLHAGLFGLGDGEHSIPPSDHYGVLVEVSI